MNRFLKREWLCLRFMDQCIFADLGKSEDPYQWHQRLMKLLKVETGKFKAEDKKRDTFRRKENCDRRHAQLGGMLSMTKPGNSHGTKSHQKTFQQVIRWAENIVFPLVALLHAIYLYVFYVIITFRCSSPTTYKCKAQALEKGTHGRERVKWILHIALSPWVLQSSSEYATIAGCWLAYLSGIFPLTIQLGESLPNQIPSSPNPRRGTYSVLIILPVRGLYLWCEWNRSYHPNSL